MEGVLAGCRARGSLGRYAEGMAGGKQQQAGGWMDGGSLGQ